MRRVAIPAAAAVWGRSFQGGRSAIPMDQESPFQIPKTHHLSSSQNLGSPYKTACGRTFNPAIYQELIQAACDQAWLQAMQRHLKDDQEYVAMLRTEGGGAQTIDQLCQQGHTNDEEFMHRLKKTLTEDRRTALAVCALQDAFITIRKSRDRHSNDVAASGADPYSSLKQRAQFGQRMPGPGGM